MNIYKYFLFSSLCGVHCHPFPTNLLLQQGVHGCIAVHAHDERRESGEDRNQWGGQDGDVDGIDGEYSWTDTARTLRVACRF